eukprot:4439996-Prymnesium_polylepis.1
MVRETGVGQRLHKRVDSGVDIRGGRMVSHKYAKYANVAGQLAMCTQVRILELPGLARLRGGSGVSKVHIANNFSTLRFTRWET